MTRKKPLGRRRARKMVYRWAASLLESYLQGGSLNEMCHDPENPRDLIPADEGVLEQCFQDVVNELDRRGAEG